MTLETFREAFIQTMAARLIEPGRLRDGVTGVVVGEGVDMESTLVALNEGDGTRASWAGTDSDEPESAIASWVQPLLEMPDKTTQMVTVASLGGSEGSAIICLSRFDPGELPWRAISWLPPRPSVAAWSAALAALPEYDELLGSIHPEDLCNLQPDLLPREAVAAMVAAIPADWREFAWPRDDPSLSTHKDFVVAYMDEVYSEYRPSG